MTQALEDALLWLRYAQEDLLAAQRLVQDPEIALRQPAWRAQQAVEKAFKATLIAETIPFPFTHELEPPRELIPSNWAVKQVDADLERLSEYAVGACYPGDLPATSPDDARAAVREARERAAPSFSTVLP